ncbi:MAG: flavodoxin family protein [Alphaproteobacteria bacterium]|nr:flavodoxin family protein [Alphaproteobacteria bacterium]
MKVVAFNGSPRKNGNTSVLIKKVFSELENEGIETEMVQIGGQYIRGCMACSSCKKNKNERCVIEDDIVNDCVQKIKEADGVILGSPTYFADVTAEMKAFIDRTGYIAGSSGNLFARKVGTAVAAVRRAGAINTLDTMNHYLHIRQFVTIGSSYWNLGVGGEKGEVENDAEGLNTMENLGKNMAWLLKKINQ